MTSGGPAIPAGGLNREKSHPVNVPPKIHRPTPKGEARLIAVPLFFYFSSLLSGGGEQAPASGQSAQPLPQPPPLRRFLRRASQPAAAPAAHRTTRTAITQSAADTALSRSFRGSWAAGQNPRPAYFPFFPRETSARMPL